MKTLTLIQAQASLEELCRAAIRGEEVGIEIDGEIIALQHVPASDADYAFREYGVTDEQLDRFLEAMSDSIERDRQAGDLIEWKPGMTFEELYRQAFPEGEPQDWSGGPLLSLKPALGFMASPSTPTHNPSSFIMGCPHWQVVFHPVLATAVCVVA